MRTRRTYCFLVVAMVLLTGVDSARSANTLTFQQGVNSYYETQDTEVQGDQYANTSYGNSYQAVIAVPPGEDQALLRFDSIFGLGPNQILPSSYVANATLRLCIADDGYGTAEGTTVHDMLVPWNENVTWNSMVNGISTDNVEAKSAAVGRLTNPYTIGQYKTLDVTESLRSWSAGNDNYGWGFFIEDNGLNPGWSFYTSEASSVAYRPQLTVNYLPKYLHTTQDVSAFFGSSHAEGAFGLPPLFTPGGLDPSHAGDTWFGNAVETNNGWESTSSWPLDPYSTTQHTKRFGPSETVLGQRSQLGFVTGTTIKLLGWGGDIFGDRERSLSTISNGSFAFEDWTSTELVPVKATIKYRIDVDGAAFEASSAFIINFLTDVIGAGGEGVAKASHGLFIRAVGDAAIEQLIGQIAQTGIDPIAIDSHAEASTGMVLQLWQDEAVSFENGTWLLERTDDFDLAHIFPGVDPRERHRGWRPSSTSVAYIDPTKDVDFSVGLSTFVKCVGASDAYAGITDYRVSFEIDGVWDEPLVYEFHDPAPEVGSRYKNFLTATVNTPELTVGSVSVEDAWGNFASEVGDNVVVLQNTEISGFMMPLTLTETDVEIVLSIGATISDIALAQDSHLQISFVWQENGEEEVVDLLDAGLLDLFSFDHQSGIEEMSIASEWTTLTFDALALPKTEGILIFGFGDIVQTDIQAAIVIDTIDLVSTVPEPSAFVLLAMGALGLLVVARRKRG